MDVSSLPRAGWRSWPALQIVVARIFTERPRFSLWLRNRLEQRTCQRYGTVEMPLNC